MISDPRGSLPAALVHLEQLLASDPVAAEAEARAILNAVPGEVKALLLLSAALRAQGKFEQALHTLDHPALARLNAAGLAFERGLTLARCGRHRDAIHVLHRVLQLAPQHPAAWRLLGDQYTAIGDGAGANDAYLHHVQAAIHDRRVMEAAKALHENRLAEAGTVLRFHLKAFPTDVAALRMLADIATRQEQFAQAESLLTRALALCPGFDAARANLATLLHRENKPAEALDVLAPLLKRHPGHPGYRHLEAVLLARLGKTDAAIERYRGVLKAVPDQPKIWMSYGHTLKTAGKQSEAVTAYREALRRAPPLGEAWWSLANLKTFRFEDQELAVMKGQLAKSDLSPEDRWHLDFALGKAFEERQNYETSFGHYDRANRLRRSFLDYDAEQTHAHCEALKQVLTAEFFAARMSGGAEAPDPIFIIGLPRSGSTLVEQILASHSLVEGTMELPDIFAIAGRLEEEAGKPFYPEVLAALSPEDRTRLGEEYLSRTRQHRKHSRPFFIDKMPNNFLHTGFIAAILPRARIIDVRRHPMACGFSCFKQHFASGQGFAYSLNDIGRYYADYTGLMAHFDAVLAGRIFRVDYENLIADLEANVRPLLAYCGLDFEESCLRFYQNERIVRTASSEQVRMPIFSDGLEQWRHYEKWLEPLKIALGPQLGASL